MVRRLIGFGVICLLVTSAEAAVYEPNLHHPSNICASLLLRLRTHLGEVRSADETLMRASYLRAFRTHTLKVLEIKPDLSEVSVDSAKGLSNKDKKRVASQIYGIELNARSNSAATDDNRIVTMIMRYEGAEEIRSFLGESEGALNETFSLFQDLRPPQMDYILRKRFLEGAIAGPLAAIFTAAATQVEGIDVGNLPYYLALLAVHLEPIAEYSSLLLQDRFYLNNQRDVSEFVEGVQAGTVNVGAWTYRSRQYEVNREVVTAFLDRYASLGDISTAMNSEAHLNTRGLWSKLILRPLAILKEVHSYQGSKAEKAEYRRQLVDNWRPFYVTYDQLLTYDSDSKKPILTLVVRTSLDRDLSKKPQTQKQNNLSVSPEASAAK